MERGHWLFGFVKGNRRGDYIKIKVGIIMISGILTFVVSVWASVSCYGKRFQS